MSSSFPIIEHQKLRLQNVRDIIVTDIVSADGTYTRSIRFLSDTGADDPVETLEIVVETDSEKSDIELTTPALEY